MDCRTTLPDHFTYRSPESSYEQSLPLNYESRNRRYVDWVEVVYHPETMALASIQDSGGNLMRYWSRRG